MQNEKRNYNRKRNSPKFRKTKILEGFIYKVIHIILIFLLINNIIYFANIAFTKKKYLSFNNISFFIIDDNIQAFRKNNNDKYYNNNDIICYNINGNIKICRISNIYSDTQNGKKYYVTKYDNNINPNIEKVRFEDIIGKKIFTIKFLGKLISFSHKKFIFILEAIILIIIFMLNNERQRRYMRTVKGKLR